MTTRVPTLNDAAATVIAEYARSAPPPVLLLDPGDILVGDGLDG